MTGTGWVPLRADLDKILGIQKTTCSETDGEVQHRGSASEQLCPGRPARPSHQVLRQTSVPLCRPIPASWSKKWEDFKPFVNNDLWRIAGELGDFF